jgi:23S rRNA-/tRNA-specific pseudouridylate synthase
MLIATAIVLHVLYQTAHEIVVLKPAGLACELPRDARADSLVRRLTDAGLGDVRLVHRLDAPACGVVVVARTAAAAAHYSREIAARQWHKWYVARVAAAPDSARALVGAQKAYLKTVGQRALVVRSGGKPSFLDVIAAAPGEPDASAANSPLPPGARTLTARLGTDLLIRLHTGRFHQIRAMLAHLGAPLVGDTRYGGPPGAGFYLEHLMLAARPFESAAWLLWIAPQHVDRPAWGTPLHDIVLAQAAVLARELQIEKH